MRRIRTALEPLRGTAFRRQFGAYTISIIGSRISPVALTLGLLAVTGSAITIGLALTASTVPLAIFLLLGGVWADRLPRHRIMMCADLMLAAVQFGVGALLLSGHVPLIPLLLLQMVYGTAQAFHLPAWTGLTALTTPSAQLQRANALLIDGGSFVLSALLVARLPLPETERPPRQTMRADLLSGWRTVTGKPWIWSSIVAFMTTHLGLVMLMVVGPVLVIAAGAGRAGLVGDHRGPGRRRPPR